MECFHQTLVQYVLKNVILWKQRMHKRTETRVLLIFWARLASLGHLGHISDPLIVSKLHNETHDPKGHENKIYTIVKGRETFYHRHIVPITSCSKVKCVLKKVILWKQRMHQRTYIYITFINLSPEFFQISYMDCFCKTLIKV